MGGQLRLQPARVHGRVDGREGHPVRARQRDLRGARRGPNVPHLGHAQHADHPEVPDRAGHQARGRARREARLARVGRLPRLRLRAEHDALRLARADDPGREPPAGFGRELPRDGEGAGGRRVDLQGGRPRAPHPAVVGAGVRRRARSVPQRVGQRAGAAAQPRDGGAVGGVRPAVHAGALRCVALRCVACRRALPARPCARVLHPRLAPYRPHSPTRLLHRRRRPVRPTLRLWRRF